MSCLKQDFMKINTHGLKTKLLFWLLGKLPKCNKIVATAFKGRVYGDNTRFIVESLHKQLPSAKIYWMKSQDVEYNVPDYVTLIPYEKTFKTIFHIATSKVLVNTHRFQNWIEKTSGQLFIETWHGGLGIKRVEADVPGLLDNPCVLAELNKTNKLTDVFISQSDHLSNIYRRAFGWQGTICKCGYPKNDLLIQGDDNARVKVRTNYSLDNNTKLCLYAPSFRDSFYHIIDTSVYNINFKKLNETLATRFGGNWKILVRWHPLFSEKISSSIELDENVIDATLYPNMQQLLLGSDVVISDYSSCIFDAALIKLPCFTYATDFNSYKSERGVYYEMEDLPFPYARNNDELMENILKFNKESYDKKWLEFQKITGLYEPGNASESIANRIINFMLGHKVQWN